MFELSLLGCDDSLRFYLPPFTFLFRLRFVWFTRRTAHAIAIQKPCCPWSLCVLCLKKNWTSSVTIRRIWLADGGGGKEGEARNKNVFIRISSAWFTALLLYLEKKEKDFVDWPLCRMGVDPQKPAPPSGCLFFACILTICYLFKWISVGLSSLSAWLFFLALQRRSIDTLMDYIDESRLPFSWCLWGTFSRRSQWGVSAVCVGTSF